RVLEALERVGRFEPRVDRLESRAPVGGLRHAGIGPDLRLVHGIAGAEETDDLPHVVAPAEVIADVEAGELAGRGAPGDDLVLPLTEGPSLDDLDRLPDGEGGGLHAAQRDVRVRAGRPLRDVDDDEELRRWRARGARRGRGRARPSDRGGARTAGRARPPWPTPGRGA